MVISYISMYLFFFYLFIGSVIIYSYRTEFHFIFKEFQTDLISIVWQRVQQFVCSFCYVSKNFQKYFQKWLLGKVFPLIRLN